LLGGLLSQELPVGLQEVLGGLGWHQVIDLVPVHEPDEKVQEVVARLLLDADQANLVQVHNGNEVTIRLVPSQLIKSWHRELPVVKNRR
jgi:hypothetical protein